MKIVIILAALVALSYEQTHETPSVNTHEPSVNSVIFFHYDYMTQMMVIRYHAKCYIFQLSDQDKMAVHTDSGMKALELKLLPLIDTGLRIDVHRSALSTDMQRACGRNTTQIYQILI